MKSTHRFISKLRLSCISLCAATVAVCAASARAGVEDGATFILKARRVYTMADQDKGGFIEPGMIFVRKGRIAAVGRNLSVPSFVDVIDLPDAVIMPGLVSANSALAGQHTGEQSVGAQYQAIDAFNPYTNYDRILAGGVTTIYLNPGHHRLVSGVGAIVKLGVPSAEAVLDAAHDLVINLGEPVFNPPPEQHWLVPPSSDLKIDPATVQRPTSRLGQFLQLNESFDAALGYAAARRATGHANHNGEPSDYDAGLESLAALLQRKITLRIHADRATDLEQGIKFCRERRHNFLLAGAIESRLLARSLAETPIIYEVPVNPTRAAADLGADPDRLDDRLIIPPELHKLPIALAGPPGAPHAALMFYAAEARRAGLPMRKALEAVTSNAARILGVDNRVGSIQPGRDADLLVLNGEPLAATTHVRRVYVNGRLAWSPPQFNRGLGDEQKEESADDNLIVRAGKIWIGSRWITGGAVLIENGRIIAADETVPHPPHARAIDAGRDAYVTPGFIDARGHLGLEGDRSGAGADLSIAQALFRARPEFARVARSGVTTVMTSTYKPARSGARISAIHTAGENRKSLIVKETSGLLLPLRGQNPDKTVQSLRKALEAGKKYDDTWKKYEKALAEYKAKGPKKAPEKKPKKKKSEEVVVEKPKADPLTGTWKGTLSGQPLPEPQDFLAKLKLDGDQVEGSVETLFGGGEAVAVSGTFQDKHLSLELDVDIPIGKPRIEADIDREDHMTGALEIARFSFELDAERTEKEAPKITITRKRRKKGKDGAPEAPKKNEALEPYRDLFAGRIALVLDVDSRLIIESILPIFEKDYKVPFVLLGAEDAAKVVAALSKAKTGVILPTNPIRKVNRRDFVQADDLARAGIPVAFQSNAEDGARHLPDRAAYSVRLGMDATAALRALTGDAARMLRCDDQVGVLKPGRRGDLLIFDGPPLEPGSRLLRVIVDGKEVLP